MKFNNETEMLIKLLHSLQQTCSFLPAYKNSSNRLQKSLQQRYIRTCTSRNLKRSTEKFAVPQHFSPQQIQSTHRHKSFQRRLEEWNVNRRLLLRPNHNHQDQRPDFCVTFVPVKVVSCSFDSLACIDQQTATEGVDKDLRRRGDDVVNENEFFSAISQHYHETAYARY